MRNFTKLLLSLVLTIVCVGGAKAGKKYWSPSTEFYCAASWNGETKTMSWNGTWTPPSGAWGSFYFVLTGLPSGDITSYTKFHATLSNFSDNVDHIWLRIKQGDDNYADAKLVAGENNIDLTALAAANPAVDFTKVTDITIWGAREALAGKTIDGSNPASVVIDNVYMQAVKNVVNCSGLGDEITSLSGITSARFVISDNGTNVLYFEGNQDAKSAAFAQVPYNAYFYYTLTNISGLDLDEDGILDTDIYAINIINEDGTAFPAPWGLGNNVNFTNGGAIFSGSAQADKAKGYGTDAQYQGIWKVAYSEGNGFTFKNCSLNKYLKVNGSQDAVCYLHLYESLSFTVNTELDKEDNAANDAIFALADATGYDAETGVIAANGGWEFATPVDLSNWDYLVIALANSWNGSDVKISISDDDGTTVVGDDYDKGDVPAMWFSNWNNQTIACISMDFLRVNKNMDISKIKSLKFTGAIAPSVVYLTDYANAKLNGRGRYGRYIDGDLKREYNASTVGNFGTICLPYVASYAGAEVYSITGASTNSISLTKVTGLLEAGKPYFYKATDVSGQNNGGTVCNVNFFRADITVDAASPVANNGLIGTFTSTTAPQGDNYYVLSNNALHKVNSAVTVGANKAYVNTDEIASLAREADLEIGFADVTGINEIKDQKNGVSGEFFNLAGQRVAQPAKGLYIVNGKKVIIK